MEAQPLQQPTSSSYARPQQPTDPSAAALPTETLLQIFQLGMDGQDVLKRQATRIQLSKVCYRWSQVAGSSGEYAVKSSDQAHMLASSLRQSTGGRRVRSLVLIAEEMGDGAHRTAGAALLKTCTAVERLDLRLGNGGYFGDDLVEALRGLRSLKEFVMSRRSHVLSNRLHL